MITLFDIMVCCQDKNGGLRDKPGKNRDFYHTCYALSGLSASQYNRDSTVTVLGDESNLVVSIMTMSTTYNVLRNLLIQYII
jgi:protein farnesyltransferase subunit beta